MCGRPLLAPCGLSRMRPSGDKCWLTPVRAWSVPAWWWAFYGEMLQRLILFTAAAVVGACASGPGARELSQQCNVKYREEPPSGATPAKPIIEPRPSLVALRDYPQSYACVAISVNERGEVTGAKLLETDSPGLGEYWL